jgi:hypothetical protein
MEEVVMNGSKLRAAAKRAESVGFLLSALLVVGLGGLLLSEPASAQVSGFGTCDSDVPGYCFADAQSMPGTAYGSADYIVDSGRAYVRVIVNYNGEYPPRIYAASATVYCFGSFEVCSVIDPQGFETCEVDPVCGPENMQLHVEINE